MGSPHAVSEAASPTCPDPVPGSRASPAPADGALHEMGRRSFRPTQVERPRSGTGFPSSSRGCPGCAEDPRDLEFPRATGSGAGEG